VPRQDSTGGKQKLGPISKQGDHYLRRILIVGAIAVLRRAQENPGKYPWLTQLPVAAGHEARRRFLTHSGPAERKMTQSAAHLDGGSLTSAARSFGVIRS
jgi:transposase